ncbi:MAG: hypothetical protein KF901_12870 [Myxococcales bacterium]|nr:hypothetical protein [Myxococcales bacterium]
MLQRRRFLSALGVAPLALSAFRVARADAPRGAVALARPGLVPAGPISHELALAGGYDVVAAYGLHYGALPFVLRLDEARFQVDVLRRDPEGRAGVHNTEHFSLFLHDHGRRATDPVEERGARALGAALERRARAGVALPALATFEERRTRFPDGMFAVTSTVVAPAG